MQQLDRLLNVFSGYSQKKISDFDLNFLENWLGKKIGGRYWQATEQFHNKKGGSSVQLNRIETFAAQGCS